MVAAFVSIPIGADALQGYAAAPGRRPVLDVAAPVVIVGTATTSRSFSRHRAIFTDTRVRVTKMVRGHVGSAVVVRTWGGTLPNGISQHTDHQPDLSAGVRSRLSLRPIGRGVFVVVGDARGQHVLGRSGPVPSTTTCPDGDTPGDGWCWEVDSLGHNPRWPASAMPVPYRVNPNTSDVTGEEAAVQAGLATWEDDPSSSMDWTYAGTTSVTTVAKDGVNSVFWGPDVTDYVAYTTYWTDSHGNLLQFDVEYNESVSYAIGAEAGSSDIQSFALHESGHAIGLGHVTDPSQIMYPSITDGTTKRAPGTGDLNGLRAIYPIDTTTQEMAPPVTYNGWAGVADASANGGTYRVSGTKNDKVTWKSAVTTSLSWVTRTGPDEGNASVTIDGKKQPNVDLYSAAPGPLTKAYTGLANKAHTIVIKVLGTKNASSTGTKVVLDAFTVGATTTQDADVKVTYDTWKGTASASASGGTYRAATAAAARVSVAFTGTQITWITVKGKAYGKAEVTIDGLPMGTVDLYQAATLWKAPVAYTGLSAGAHTLLIHLLGQKNASATSTKVVFDGFSS